MPIPLLLDLDPGIDDALALDEALHNPAFKLLAVTTTYGSVSVTHATRNAQRICALAGRPDIPVCLGVATPQRKSVWHHEPARHGLDGLGDLPDSTLNLPGADERSAARCLVELALAHAGELCVVASGPLGNIAQALRLEPRLPQLLKQLVVCGGSIAATGNASPVAELNFWHDPHAADTVLNAGFTLTMVGLDVSESALMPLPLIEHRTTQRPPELGRLLRHAATHLAHYRQKLDPALPSACPSPAWLALDYLREPTGLQTQTGCVRVVTEGLAEGQSIMDRHPERAYPQAGWEIERPTIAAALRAHPARLVPGA